MGNDICPTCGHSTKGATIRWKCNKCHRWFHYNCDWSHNCNKCQGTMVPEGWRSDADGKMEEILQKLSNVKGGSNTPHFILKDLEIIGRAIKPLLAENAALKAENERLKKEIGHLSSYDTQEAEAGNG